MRLVAGCRVLDIIQFVDGFYLCLSSKAGVMNFWYHHAKITLVGGLVNDVKLPSSRPLPGRGTQVSYGRGQ